MRLRKRIKRELTYWLIRMVAEVVGRIPRRCALLLGSTAATAAYCLARTTRARATYHLALAYPQAVPAWRRRTVLRCFKHLAWNAIDFFHFALRDPAALDAVVEVDGEANFQAALQGGAGIMCLTGHVGNWELLGAHVARRAGHLGVIARKLYYDKLDRWITALRERLGMEVLDRDDPPAGILRRLREGGLIGVLLDQDTRTRGVFVDFFGRPAYTPVGPALLAVRARVPVLPLFMKRRPGHRYRVIISEPHKPAGGLAHQRSLDLTRWATERIEEAIREDPEQWVWMHRRWRTKP